MQLVIKESFHRDLKKKSVDKIIYTKVEALLEELGVKEKISDIENIKKIKGTQGYYRVKIGKFRVGIYFNEGIVFVVRCLPRKDIYKFFP